MAPPVRISRELMLYTTLASDNPWSRAPLRACFSAVCRSAPQPTPQPYSSLVLRLLVARAHQPLQQSTTAFASLALHFSRAWRLAFSRAVHSQLAAYLPVEGENAMPAQ